MIRFVGLALLMLAGWVVLNSVFPQVASDLHYFFVKPQAMISASFFRLLGYDVQEIYGHLPCLARIRVNDLSGVCVGTGCSGLELFLLFSGFIILIRGNWKDKLWYIPLGIVIIFLLNIIRIILLIFINHYYPQYLHFNHKYTLVILVYLAIFGLWIFWVRKFSQNNINEN